MRDYASKLKCAVVKMAKKKLFPHELIGERIVVVDSANKSQLGIKGIIVDETKATLKIQQGKKTKTMLKNNITFKIERTGSVIAGKKISKRPEDRIRG